MTDEKWLELAKGQFKVGDNPTEEQINAKAQELKDEKANAETKKWIENKGNLANV